MFVYQKNGVASVDFGQNQFWEYSDLDFLRKFLNYS